MKHTPAVRRRISESSKLRWADPEYRKRLSESQQRAQSKRRAEWARKAELATVKRKCENCASDFVPKVKRGSNAQKYCSERCRDTAYMRRKRTKPEYAEKVRDRWANDPKFRESRLAAGRRWRTRNPEKAKAVRLKWVSKNLEHLAKYQLLRRRENPERSRQQQRDYYHRLRDAARRGVLATTPKKRGGSVPGKLRSDSALKIEAIARYLLDGASGNWIKSHWKEVTGDTASQDTAKSFFRRHKALIAQKRAELSQKSGR